MYHRLIKLLINVHLVWVDYKVFHSAYYLDGIPPSVQYFAPRFQVFCKSYNLLFIKLLLLLLSIRQRYKTKSISQSFITYFFTLLKHRDLMQKLTPREKRFLFKIPIFNVAVLKSILLLGLNEHIIH